MIIVSAANDSYAQHLAVMITSLLDNANNREHIQIYVIDGNLSRINKEKLMRSVGRYGKKITFLRADQRRFESLPNYSKEVKYISKEAYYRLCIPELLGLDVMKALYLDCDVIIRADITELWNTNIQKYDVAAVDTAYLQRRNVRRKVNKALSIPKDSYYFNSGVLLMNVKKWRKKSITSKVIHYIAKNSKKIKYIDQDALNVVLQGKWMVLDPKWNYTDAHWGVMTQVEPSIVHFTGPNKPWNSQVKYGEEYFKYLHYSLWNEEM